METNKWKEALSSQLHDILRYWSSKMVDTENGGFYGRRDGYDQLDKTAEKGIVLNARILWSFSAAYNATQETAYLEMAKRAYDYIVLFFEDKKCGGYFWSVEASGYPHKMRKQVYAQAFVIYGLSEYYKACRQQEVLDKATDLFYLLEQYSYDAEQGGYFEAYTRDWQPESDLRLSDKDENTAKSMNTHLHVIEGYAALYQVCPFPLLKERIIGLLDVFSRHIIDSHTGHLRLFFDADWRGVGSIDSYGHDIEAAWLLQEAAESIGVEHWITQTRQYALLLVSGALEGLDGDGGLWYEKDNSVLIKEKHWWPQAEAMVGFYNAYQLTESPVYLAHSEKSWQFIQDHLLDKDNGEWYWGIQEDGSPMQEEDKAGFWKCPYHNSRACLEMINRLDLYDRC